MDSCTLAQDIDYCGSSGVILSVEQKAALQQSLVIVKEQQKFKSVVFFGKILGVKNDYFLIEGIGDDDLKDRKRLFSLDCIKWGLMPQPNEETRRKALLIKGRFTGDPSHECTAETKADEDAGEAEETEIMVKEEDRLAIVVENICRDAVIVPRGAYKRDLNGCVQKNRMFEGLTIEAAKRESSYFHFREPEILKTKTLLEKADLDKALDFLDPIDSDIPQGGSWSIQMEQGSKLVILRSLHWLGYTFFHAPCCAKFGYIYVGTGEKNLDLPFML